MLPEFLLINGSKYSFVFGAAKYLLLLQAQMFKSHLTCFTSVLSALSFQRNYEKLLVRAATSA